MCDCGISYILHLCTNLYWHIKRTIWEWLYFTLAKSYSFKNPLHILTSCTGKPSLIRDRWINSDKTKSRFNFCPSFQVTPLLQFAAACRGFFALFFSWLRLFWCLWFAGSHLGFFVNTGTGMLSVLLKWKQTKCSVYSLARKPQTE